MKRTAGLALLALVIASVLPAALTAESDVGGSVVKVYIQSYPYNPETPWLLSNAVSGTGSGCIISGNRILTNAHVVADAKFIQVKRAGGQEKVQAEVEVVAHQCDLAILRVKQADFFKGAEPLEIGPLVALRDRVTVYGFPRGGEEMSTTEGIVSRVELRSYAHSYVRLLCGQIDAAINPGSSGGPVIANGRIVGVAFQAEMGQGLSYMVPSPIILHFLKDIEDGKHDGIPGLEVETQILENPALQTRYGLGPGQSGVLISAIHPGSDLEGVARPGDIILSIDGHSVANDGTVEFRKNERTQFSYYVQGHFVGEFMDIEVLRAGRVLKLRPKLTVAKDATSLVPPTEYDRQPSFYVIGGLVFQRLTGNYVRRWDRGEAPPNLVNFYYYGIPTKERRNIVVLTSILPDEVNVGYENQTDFAIVEANGRRVSTLQDLVDAVETNTQPYHVFLNESGDLVVLDRAKAQQRNGEILQRYMVTSDRSPDLKGAKTADPDKK
jgi:S1-C subfamily serine protease